MAMNTRDPKRIVRVSLRPFSWTWNVVVDFMQLFVRYMVIGIVYIVGFYFLFYIFANLREDTTAITNTGFAIFASLASLSFAWSRSFAPGDSLTDRIRHAGERFLHASLCLLS